MTLMEVNVATMGISYHWKPTLSHQNDKASPNAPRLYEMSKQYGPLMELHLGTAQRILVASSPSAARLILHTHDKIFSSRAPNIATSILHGSPANNISFAEPGPKWRILRRVCTNQLMAPKSLLAFR